jgi:hypothetical protein
MRTNEVQDPEIYLADFPTPTNINIAFNLTECSK